MQTKMDIDTLKIMFRNRRAYYFKAFDLWEKNVLRGREEDDDIIMAWYQTMLDFPDLITENTTFKDFPKVPEKVKGYLN